MQCHATMLLPMTLPAAGVKSSRIVPGFSHQLCFGIDELEKEP